MPHHYLRLICLVLSAIFAGYYTASSLAGSPVQLTDTPNALSHVTESATPQRAIPQAPLPAPDRIAISDPNSLADISEPPAVGTKPPVISKSSTTATTSAATTTSVAKVINSPVAARPPTVIADPAEVGSRPVPADTEPARVEQPDAVAQKPPAVEIALSAEEVRTPSLPSNAFAAFLSAEPQEGGPNEGQRDEEDVYFVGTRMLAYQLLHDPMTKTRHNYPFLVFVTQYVKQSKIDRLILDGAKVIPVEKVISPWLISGNHRWHGVLSKMHMFTKIEYQRIAFFDSDTVIMRNIDGIFRDPSVLAQKNLRDPKRVKFDDGPEPDSYAIAGISGQGTLNHIYPQVKANYLNAGCVVFQPSMQLFDLYMRIIQNATGRFDTKYPEQNLWNYVHRKDGNMPWRNFEGDWNTNWATIRDVENGFASLHAKWWSTPYDSKLRDLLLRSKFKMEGFYEAIDVAAGRLPQMNDPVRGHAQLVGEWL